MNAVAFFIARVFYFVYVAFEQHSLIYGNCELFEIAQKITNLKAEQCVVRNEFVQWIKFHPAHLS